MRENLDRPKVSVTVVTFNHGEWLRQCLESVVSQKTNFSFEILVGDDASTDDKTRKIILEYAERYPGIVIPVLREKNIGGTQNYLDIVSRVNGEYIAHIDGDDMMLPSKLQKQADYLDSHPDCSIVVHDVNVIDGDGNEIRKNFLSTKAPDTADVNYLILNGCYFSHCSKMYRRSSIKSKTRPQRTVDFFYHVENAMDGKIGFIQEILGSYRKTSGTASDLNSKSYATLYKCYLEAFERASELGVREEVVQRGLARHRYSVALDYLRAGNIDEFVDKVTLSREAQEYATWKHLLVNKLKIYPRLVMLMLRLKEHR